MIYNVIKSVSHNLRKIWCVKVLFEFQYFKTTKSIAFSKSFKFYFIIY